MSEQSAATMLVVVVNYRTGDLVVDCLATLAAEVAATPGLKVTVVDNDSRDGSTEVIGGAIAAEGWSEWADLVISPVNGGFAQGNNVAVRAALAGPAPPDLFWLLNPDTRVTPGAAAALAAFCREHPDAGIVGSALIEENGSPWPFAFRFHTAASELERGARFGPLSRMLAERTVLRRMEHRPAVVDWVSGASMVVRREVFETIGLFDESYFLYYEETDFCMAAGRAGWSCWYMPAASVVHIAGQSTGLTGPRAQRGRVPSYWFASRRRYFEKNYGRAYAAIADMAWLVGHVFWSVRRVWSREARDPPSLVADFLRHSALASSRIDRA